jgi:hypothetical protein
LPRCCCDYEFIRNCALAGVLTISVATAMAQKGINSLTGRMEQMAGHAGIQGANPHAQPAGSPRYNPGGGYRQPPSAPSHL